jgi:hypothetical protein
MAGVGLRCRHTRVIFLYLTHGESLTPVDSRFSHIPEMLCAQSERFNVLTDCGGEEIKIDSDLNNIMYSVPLIASKTR